VCNSLLLSLLLILLLCYYCVVFGVKRSVPSAVSGLFRERFHGSFYCRGRIFHSFSGDAVISPQRCRCIGSCRRWLMARAAGSGTRRQRRRRFRQLTRSFSLVSAAERFNCCYCSAFAAGPARAENNSINDIQCFNGRVESAYYYYSY